MLASVHKRVLLPFPFLHHGVESAPDGGVLGIQAERFPQLTSRLLETAAGSDTAFLRRM